MEQVVQSQVEIQAFLSISSHRVVYFPSVRSRLKEVSNSCSASACRSCLWAPLRDNNHRDLSHVPKKFRPTT